MPKDQPQELTTSLPLEVQKQSYQTPQLEHHQFINLTGVALSIGLSAPDPFRELELK